MITYKKTWLLFVLVALVLWPTAAQGQSAELRNAYNRSGELHAQGRHQEALPFAEEELRLGEQEFGLDHPTTATPLNNLAGHCHKDRFADDIGREAVTLE